MNELTLDGKTYVSSKRAAEITGYAKDYVGQLCREGHVEARLVGRNWYVLESSIKKHRFGEDAEKATSPEPEQKKSPALDWEKPRYEVEKLPEIPALDQKISLNTMQNAWQEWFTHKAEISEPEEQIEAAHEVPGNIAIERIPEATPISFYEPIVDEIEAGEALDLRVLPEVEEEGQIVEERVIVSRKRPIIGNLALQSVFVAITLLSLAVATIGTGYAAQYLNIGEYRLSAIDFLSGAAFYSK